MPQLQERELHVRQLKPGMYVSRLDVPWEMTNFPLQGLHIQSPEDIEQLARYCEFVVIDEYRTLENSWQDAPPMARIEPKRKLANKNTATPAFHAGSWKQKHCVEKYRLKTDIYREVETSKSLFNSMERQIYLICEKTLRCRRANVEQLVESTTHVVESVIRNPDALAWMCKVRATRKPIYMHTIRLAVWGAIAGRQLGLNRFALVHLCSALLMTGIGKSKLSEKALSGYSPVKPSADYQKHVSETVYQLAQMRFGSEDVIDTIASYCERIDGSGYPNKLSGSAIPFTAQLCGLVETYELLINPYYHTRAVSPANAIVYLNKHKGRSFESSIVEAFIRAIGIYPTGTVVELSNGQLGIVFSQNFEKRLQANVIPVLGAHGDLLSNYRVLDLSYANSREENSQRAFIRRSVPSTAIPRGLLEQAHKWIFTQNNRNGSLLNRT